MEVVVESKKPWDQFKEDVEIMEEETAAGTLLTRETKKKLLDFGANGNGAHVNGEEEEEEELKAEEVLEAEDQQQQQQHKSIFFDPTKVPEIITEAMRFGAQNEDADATPTPKGKELEAHENGNAQEINDTPNNGKLENGSHSNGSHQVSNGSDTKAVHMFERIGRSEINPTEAEIEAHENGTGQEVIHPPNNYKLEHESYSSDSHQVSNGSETKIAYVFETRREQIYPTEADKGEHVTEAKPHIEEYDLEKIIDQQETHDLYCPNCNSCITRRVILKKRKRTPRIPDEPTKKPHTEEQPSTAAPERDGQESPEVFRCLSCFSFFIPTGCGLNIFRIFGGRDLHQQADVQQPSAPEQMPQSENCASWLLSCFQPGDGPNQPYADAGSATTPLLPDKQSLSGTITTAAASTSVHSHGSIGKPDQSTESSSQVQTTTTTTITTTTATESTSSTTTSEAASSSSHTTAATGFLQTEVIEAMTGQILPPKPAGVAVTDATHLSGKEGTGTTIFENSSLPSPAIPTSGFREIPGVIPRGDKLIPQAADPPRHLVLPVSDAPTTENHPRVPTSGQRDEWDILKSIVYGGLVESVTSLSIVSAAAASGAKTLDIFILGIANLIGGIPLIFHNISDLRNLGDVNGNDEQVGHYWLQLGRRSKFRLHMFLALLSYIMFGLLPPVLYGLSFRKSDDRENKMMTVAAASLACVALLALGKAHVSRSRTYFKTLMYYLMIVVSASGLSYVAGVLITRLLVHFGIIDQGASAPPAPPSLSSSFPYAVGAETSAWASF